MSEDLIIELQSRILRLKRDDLVRFGEEMKWLSVEESEGEGRLELTKIIQTVFDEEVEKSVDEQLKNLLEKIQVLLDGKTVNQSVEKVTAKESEQELMQLKAQYEKLAQEQEKFKEQIDAVQAQKEAAENLTINSDSMEQQSEQQSTLNLKTSMFRREFKIQGQIGEPGQKDKLVCQSLISQIEIGLKKGYTEEEITNAVVRSIQAGLQLRGYLEGISGLTLPRLRKVLRFYFQEKSATELNQLLANISQAPKESPQDFLIRALTIRQKVVFTSKETDSKIKYDEGLVQGLFLQALETGLVDETIRAKMRPLLKNELVADEELIEVTSSAMAAESDRATKFNQLNQGKPSPKVSKIGTEAPPRPPDSSSAHEKEILATLKSIQTELNTVMSEVASLQIKADQKDSTTPGQSSSSTFMPGRVGPTGRRESRQGNYPRLCKKCQEENQVQCPHCFKCGGGNHTARYCRSENERRLPLRD